MHLRCSKEKLPKQLLWADPLQPPPGARLRTLAAVLLVGAAFLPTNGLGLCQVDPW